MKKTTFLILLILTARIVFAQSADEIIKKSEDLIKGETAYGTFTMTVVTPDFTRELTLESWWVGNEKALIVIKSPKKEAGNKTLKIKNEMWNYLKNTETTIKVPPSMMLQSWNGSDFTNDDLVRESNLNEDYYLKIISEDEIGGEKCWKIELTPKPDVAVVWGRLYYWVRMSDYLPAVIQYYDEKGNMVRDLVFTDIKKFGSRKIPSVWTMYNKTKDGYSTTFKMVSVKFDLKISDNIFSFEELEKGN
jgi:outer membrane lipoprotein-sorting protein